MPPGRGRGPPCTPQFLPTLVCWGFAKVLNPTRWQAYRGWLLAPNLDFVGDTPNAPRHGGFAPLHPLVFAHPRLLRVRRGFGSHSVVGW